MVVEGLGSLSEDQQELMYRVNAAHTRCVGNDYKSGMEIVKTWLDEENQVVVLLKNGDCYHYTENGDWY